MEALWKTRARTDITRNGVCDEYNALLDRSKSKVEALALYRRGIDWCLENNSPSLSLLRDFKDDCEANYIFIDRHFEGDLLNDAPVYVFHNCTGTICTGLNIPRKMIPMLYFANGCSMTVKGSSLVQVRVPLYVFGENEIHAETSDEMEPIFYRR